MNYAESIELEQIFQNLSQHEDEEVRKHLARITEVINPMIEIEKDREFKKQRNLKHSWGYFIPKNEVTKIINVLNSSKLYYEDAQNELKQYVKEQQDILHAFEMKDLTKEEIESLSNALRELRIQRRKSKDFIEQLEPLKELSENNEKFFKDTVATQKELHRVFKKLQDKKYFVRDCDYLKSIIPSKKEEIETGSLELMGKNP